MTDGFPPSGKVFLLRRKATNTVYSAVVPADSGRLESSLPVEVTLLDSLPQRSFVSRAVDGRHVLLLPVSAGARAALVISNVPARSECLLSVKALAFPGGAAAARVPAGWGRWAASWLAGCPAELPPSPAEVALLIRPAAIVGPAECARTLEVPPGVRFAAARCPFAVCCISPLDPDGAWSEPQSVASGALGGAAVELWHVADLSSFGSLDSCRRLRFTGELLGGHVICLPEVAVLPL